MRFATSRLLVGGMACRRLPHAAPARYLSQLTMGFREIAAWKESKLQVSSHSATKKLTVFDIKVNSPINKSSAWNISYAPEATTSEGKVDHDYHWLFQLNRARLLSRQLASRSNMRAQVKASGARIPPAANTFSSLASNAPSTAAQESVFGSPRRADEITDVPEISVLTKLHPEADEEPAPTNTTEQPEQTEGEGNADPSSIRKEHLKLYDSMIGCPPWFPQAGMPTI